MGVHLCRQGFEGRLRRTRARWDGPGLWDSVRKTPLAAVDRVVGPSLPVWVRTCFCRSPEVLKALLHSSSGHLYGFSPV